MILSNGNILTAAVDNSQLIPHTLQLIFPQWHFLCKIQQTMSVTSLNLLISLILCKYLQEYQLSAHFRGSTGIFKTTLHPWVSMRRISHSFVAPGSNLCLYNLPDWTVVLTIKLCLNEACFILKNLSEKVINKKMHIHSERAKEAGHGLKALHKMLYGIIELQGQYIHIEISTLNN